jgi:hypothetical protein
MGGVSPISNTICLRLWRITGPEGDTRHGQRALDLVINRPIASA